MQAQVLKFKYSPDPTTNFEFRVIDLLTNQNESCSFTFFVKTILLVKKFEKILKTKSGIRVGSGELHIFWFCFTKLFCDLVHR